MVKVSKVYSVSDEDFKLVVANSNTITDILWKLGYSKSSGTGNARNLIKKRIAELGITFQSQAVKSSRMSDESFYVKGTYRSNLRVRVLQDGFLEYKCSECGITSTWNGKPLTLQLDHVDGDATNNEKPNLRWLCPNCHTQTETYGSKNKGSTRTKHRGTYGERECKYCHKMFTAKNRESMFCSGQCSGKSRKKTPPVSKEDLLALLEKESFLSVGRKFDVSDNTVRKWCMRYDIPSKSSYYKK